MNAERLQQVEELYHAALELEVSERADFLRGVCGAAATTALEASVTVPTMSAVDTWATRVGVPK